MRTSLTPRRAAGVAVGDALAVAVASADGRAVFAGAALPSLDPQPSTSAATAPNAMALLTPLRMADGVGAATPS